MRAEVRAAFQYRSYMRHVDLPCRLVCLARHSEDPADNARFLHLSLKLFRFFVHSNPTEFADETNNLRRWPAILLFHIDFSAMQAVTHCIPPFS
jgi:hypothetical protein